MDGASLLEPTALLGTFLCVILAVFLVAVPSRSALPNRMFAGFLVLTAIDISGWFMADWWEVLPYNGLFRTVMAALHMPLFFGFIWFGCFRDASLRAAHSLHLLPALIVAAALLIWPQTDHQWLLPSLQLQYYAYIAVACWTLWRFRKILKDRFSSARSHVFEWLAAMVGISVFAHSLFVFRVLAADRLGANISTWLQFFAALLILSITLWIAFRALLSPELFRGVDRVLENAAAEFHQPAGDDGAAGDRIAELRTFIDDRQPFLDPELSLSRLSRQVGMQQKELSELINQRIGVHFFDLINRYRVEHASALLIAEPDMTVTDILYASGFNSKSSFNTAFKKHRGQTPSAFRKAASAEKAGN
ncbi:helix-turn-helix domain-containing protein [Altererythrobacter sp. ZODW24]|uniref:AraC family transcriptional regulator n=1 Tax=Altererythrobacter sp. ZODW24 TaxID=2185142 RepID=UPI000DF80E7E|nr:helix-turn-helix domain-containing protein [Altererythrobacter sp. ZODW24]